MLAIQKESSVGNISVRVARERLRGEGEVKAFRKSTVYRFLPGKVKESTPRTVVIGDQTLVAFLYGLYLDSLKRQDVKKKFLFHKHTYCFFLR